MNLKVYVAYLGIHARAKGIAIPTPFGHPTEAKVAVKNLRENYDLVVWEYKDVSRAVATWVIASDHNFEPPDPPNPDPTKFRLKPIDYLKNALESAQMAGSAKPIAQIFIGLGADVTEYTRNN